LSFALTFAFALALLTFASHRLIIRHHAHTTTTHFAHVFVHIGRLFCPRFLDTDLLTLTFLWHRYFFLRLRLILRSVSARLACLFVNVLALLPFFSTERAKEATLLPALFALALNAPGRLIAPLIQFAIVTTPFVRKQHIHCEPDTVVLYNIGYGSLHRYNIFVHLFL
jgi:hypothetical protein